MTPAEDFATPTNVSPGREDRAPIDDVTTSEIAGLEQHFTQGTAAVRSFSEGGTTNPGIPYWWIR